MALILCLMFGDSWYFLGLWILFISQLGVNWGFELEIFSHGFFLWDPDRTGM